MCQFLSVPVFQRLTLICLFSLTVQAKISNGYSPAPQAMSDIRKALDIKLFHDRVWVKEMIKSMYDQDKSGQTSNPKLMQEMGHETIFSKKDSDIIRNEAAKRIARTRLIQTSWKEESKSIDQDAFEAFVGLIESQQTPSLKQNELNNLNSVDKRLIPEMIQMMTESGPDIGASTVPVVYDANTLK